MSKFAAQPFGPLLGIKPQSLPKSMGSRVVVDGRVIGDVRQIRHDAPEDRHADDESDIQAKRKAVIKARAAAKYQLTRQDPEKMAKRRAWYEANRAKVIAYKREWDRRHHEQVRQCKNAWAKANYHANAERMCQLTRDWYARNREAVLARSKAKRDAAKAVKAAKATKATQGAQR